jgi:hypothetical protein
MYYNLYNLLWKTGRLSSQKWRVATVPRNESAYKGQGEAIPKRAVEAIGF